MLPESRLLSFGELLVDVPACVLFILLIFPEKLKKS